MNTTIYKKLGTLQQRYKSVKDNVNQFGNFKYRNFEQMMDELKPLLNELGLIILTKETLAGGTEYMECTVTLIDVESGEQISTSSVSRIDTAYKGMSSAQASGATISYIRKYAAAALLAIGAGDDPDSFKPGTYEPNPEMMEKIRNAKDQKQLLSVWMSIDEKQRETFRVEFTKRKNELENMCVKDLRM